MSAESIRAGEAYVALTTRDQTAAGLRAVERKLRDFGQRIGTIGRSLTIASGAIAAPLIAATKHFSNFGSQLHDMAIRTGASVEALSELAVIADLGGASMEDLETALKKMQKTIGAGLTGDKEAIAHLNAIGLSVESLRNLSVDQQFEKIGGAISRIQNPALRTAAALNIFGKTGTSILPVFEEGAAGVRSAREEIRRLGLTISTLDAAAADELGDRLDTLWKIIKRAAFSVGAALAPALIDLTKALIEAVSAAAKWIDKNREWVVLVAIVAAGLAIVGGSLMALGLAINLAAFGFSILSTLLATLFSPVTLAVAAIAALGVVLWKTGLAAKAWEQLKPLLSGVLGTLREKFSTFAGWLSQLWNTLQTDTLAAFEGIKAALMGGDWKLAGQILWAGLQLEFARGWVAIADEFDLWKTAFLDTMDEWANSLVSWGVDLWATMKQVWTTGIEKLTDLVTGMQTATAKPIARMIAKIQGLNPDEVEQTLVEDAGRAKQSRGAKATTKREEIETNRKEMQEALAQLRGAEALGRAAGDQAASEERRTAITKAEQELADLIADAKKLEPAGLLAKFAGGSPQTLDESKDRFDSGVKHAAHIAEQGTFSIFALGALVSSSPAAERTAKATEETAKQVQDFKEQAKRHTFVFGMG